MSGMITSKPFAIAAGTMLTLCGVGGYAWHEIHRPKVLEMYVFDLPGAPGILIRTPNDRRILVDGGSNTEVVKRLTDVLPFYLRRIDTVIVTGREGRNVTGLIDILDRYMVSEVVLPAVTLPDLGLSSTTDRIYEIFLETAESHGIPVKKVVAGERIILDDDGSRSVVADILFPVAGDEFKYSKASGPSIVMKVTYGATSIVVMGDASMKIQKLIVENNKLPADVLIFSHSIVASNISRELIRSFIPESVVYSQTVSKPSSKASKKAAVDPLAGILADHRFNVKGNGVVKMVSDGVRLIIE